jgi:Protein of unknown function (DUF3455)
MKRMLLAGIVAVAAALPLAQTVHAGPTAPAVPADIAVGDGHQPFLTGHATGVQIYACNAVGDGYRWGLVAPRATLYAHGKLLTTHYGGPTWEARDGSTVVGRRDSGVTVDPTAIEWLRVAAVRTAAGPDGDRLEGTTYIQRINTTGGLPPSPAECGAATAGTRTEVPYTADYVFWKASGS